MEYKKNYYCTKTNSSNLLYGNNELLDALEHDIGLTSGSPEYMQKLKLLYFNRVVLVF